MKLQQSTLVKNSPNTVEISNNNTTKKMDKLHFPHSMKNIPHTDNRQYLRKFVASIETLSNNMRKKLNAVDSDKDQPRKKTYGFKSPNPGPQHPKLKAFENDLHSLARNIQFRKQYPSQFQKTLQNTKKEIESSPDVILKADKSRNLYKIKPTDYNTNLLKVTNKTYKKCETVELNKTNLETAKLADQLEIADRVDNFTEAPAFITIKDHKPGFPGKQDFRLLNPAKNNMGKVSKQILRRIVNDVKKKTTYNQWINTNDVINWFNKQTNKANLRFMKFDVESFYPSITEELFNEAINWARKHATISSAEHKIIFQTKESYLFLHNHKQPWKKRTETNFDITMGSYDGAESCEIVGLYILNKIGPIFGQDKVGLYRDDGLAVTTKSARQIEKIQQKLHQQFKKIKLNITVEKDLTSTDFLDVQLDLQNDVYRPYMKPNSTPVYINKQSNHPPATIKQLPKMISNRISNLSSNERIFEEEKRPYEDALRAAGYNTKLEYSKRTIKNNKTRKRNRGVTWFNPPYNENVSTNVAKQFLHLIDKHFGKSDLKKVFNRSNVKVSYSCLPNMSATISAHNKKILKQHMEQQQPATTNKKMCNCSNDEPCPINKKCLQSSVVYKASVERNQQETAHYIGLTARTFKQRYGEHQRSFNNPEQEHETTLSAEIWKDKRNGTNNQVRWSIIGSAPAYSKTSRFCHLCNLEKTTIMFSNEKLFNKRNELNNKCRHRRTHTLAHTLKLAQRNKLILPT